MTIFISGSRTVVEGTVMLRFIILLSLAAATAAWYLLNYFYVSKPATNEPPVLSHPIPYFGHILGLLRHGLRYYEITRYGPVLVTFLCSQD